MYPDYLVHFNKNHSPKTGQFTEGDGDADGIVNDHKNQYKIKKVTKSYGDQYSVSSTNRKKSKKVDNTSFYSASKKNYDHKKLDSEVKDIVGEAVNDFYKNRDINSVSELINDKLGDIPYDFAVSENKWPSYGEDYVSMSLNLYGKNYVTSYDGLKGKGAPGGSSLSVGSDSGFYSRRLKDEYKNGIPIR